MRTILADSVIIFTFILSTSAQAVIIVPKKVTYKREIGFSDYKRTFEVTYPIIRSKLPTTTRRNMSSNLDYWRAFSWSGHRFSLNDEIKNDGWIESLTYEVKYNANNILAVWLTMEGSGAYPASSTKYMVLDSRSGKRLSIPDLFKGNKLLSLRNAIRQAMRRSEAALDVDMKEELQSERENGNYSEFTPSPNRLRLKDLDGFSISNKGVTFIFDYSYAHVVQALQPPGEFFFSWAQLKPYIKPGGLLQRISR